MNHVKADTTQPEHDDIIARLHFGCVNDRADACCNAAAYVTDFVEWCVFPDLCQGDFWHHRVLRKGRRSHVVIDGVLAHAEARCAIWHDTPTLGFAYRLAEIGLARRAVFAFATFRCVKWDHVIAFFQRRYTWTNVDNNSRALMTENGWENTLWICARQSELIRMADARSLHFDKDLAFLRTV